MSNNSINLLSFISRCLTRIIVSSFPKYKSHFQPFHFIVIFLLFSVSSGKLAIYSAFFSLVLFKVNKTTMPNHIGLQNILNFNIKFKFQINLIISNPKRFFLYTSHTNTLHYVNAHSTIIFIAKRMIFFSSFSSFLGEIRFEHYSQ